MRVEWESTIAHVDDITRKGEHWGYSGASCLLLDEDVCEKSVDNFRDVLIEAVPELERVPLLTKPSSGSCVYKDGEEVIGNNGNHHLIPIKDSTDIERVTGIIFKRLWLAGYGFIKVGEKGSTLTRTIIDQSVKTVGRIVYVKARVPEGYEQVQEMEYYNEDAPIFDSLCIQNLSEDEEDAYNEMVQSAMLEKGVVKKVKEGLASRRKDLLMKGMSEKAIERLMHGTKLPPDFTLHFDFGDFEVHEVKDPKNKEKFDGKYCCEPLDPGYQNWKKLCWVNLKDKDNPFLYSHAHGDIRYTLDGIEVFDYEALDDQITLLAKNCTADRFREVVENIAGSDIDEPELSWLLSALKKASGLNKPEVKEAYKKAKMKGEGNKSEMDDSDIALLILDEYGRDNIFAHEGNLFKWEYRKKGVWGQIHYDILSKRILRTFRKVGRKGFGKHNLDNVLKFIVYDMTVTEVTKMSPPNMINCKNCEVWIKQDAKGGHYIETKKHNKRTHSTMQLNISYKSNAHSKLFESFLNTVMFVDKNDGEFIDSKGDFMKEKWAEAQSDSELKKSLLMETAGYSLTTSTALEAFIQYYGSTRSGKSIMASLLELIVGKEYIMVFKASDLEDRNVRARLYNKLLALNHETEDDSKFPAAIVKAGSTGDTIEGRHPYGKGFDFTPTFTFMFLSNFLLRIADSSGATDERYYIVEFDRRFVKRMKFINGGRPGILDEIVKGKGKVLVGEDFNSSDSKLNLERDYAYVEDDGLDGVFTMLLHAYVFGTLERRHKDSTDDSSFILPESAKRLKAQVRAEGDPYAAFFEKCTDPTTKGGERVTHIFDVYLRWNKKRGHKGHTDIDQFMLDC